MAELLTADIRYLQIAAGYGKRIEERPVRKGHMN